MEIILNLRHQLRNFGPEVIKLEYILSLPLIICESCSLLFRHIVLIRLDCYSATIHCIS